MDFDAVKYNGKLLYTVATACVVGTWFVATEYWGQKHEMHLQNLKHEADQKRDQETLDLKVEFLMRKIENTNGRIDRKTQNNIDFFKKELNRLDADSENQWNFMNNQHSK